MNPQPTKINIGLTGGLAAGKSAAAAMFASLGATVIDADQIGRELTAPGGAALPELRQSLGDSIFDSNGEFVRARARERAFADADFLAALENILHPHIRREMQKQMDAATGAYTVLEIPLLLETGFFAEQCARIVVIDCEPETQVSRAVQRGLSEEAARAILKVQIPRKDRIARASDMINNDGDLHDLQKSVQMLHNEFLQLAQRTQS